MNKSAKNAKKQQRFTDYIQKKWSRFEKEHIGKFLLEGILIKCFYCDREASSKIGSSKANIWKAIFPFFGKPLVKSEIYVCRSHYEEHTKEVDKP